MKLTNDPKQTSIALFLVTTLILTSITLLFGLAWPNWVSHAEPTLPPLATTTATPAPAVSKRSSSKEKPTIAHIKLQAPRYLAGAWSVVQWQDSAGNWHDVKGWRGVLSATGTHRWVVATKDFNTGPFRWVVLDASGGITGISPAFDLPAEANGMLEVTTK